VIAHFTDRLGGAAFDENIGAQAGDEAHFRQLAQRDVGDGFGVVVVAHRHAEHRRQFP